MNIDERLEALTRNAEAHYRQIEALLSLAAKHDSEIAALKRLWADIAEGIGRLVHTAELHQNRLDSHSDRLDNLENT
jgi:hypothetical protein